MCVKFLENFLQIYLSQNYSYHIRGDRSPLKIVFSAHVAMFRVIQVQIGRHNVDDRL